MRLPDLPEIDDKLNSIPSKPPSLPSLDNLGPDVAQVDLNENILSDKLELPNLINFDEELKVNFENNSEQEFGDIPLNNKTEKKLEPNQMFDDLPIKATFEEKIMFDDIPIDKEKYKPINNNDSKDIEIAEASELGVKLVDKFKMGKFGLAKPTQGKQHEGDSKVKKTSITNILNESDAEPNNSVKEEVENADKLLDEVNRDFNDEINETTNNKNLEAAAEMSIRDEGLEDELNSDKDSDLDISEPDDIEDLDDLDNVDEEDFEDLEEIEDLEGFNFLPSVDMEDDFEEGDFDGGIFGSDNFMEDDIIDDEINKEIKELEKFEFNEDKLKETFDNLKNKILSVFRRNKPNKNKNKQTSSKPKDNKKNNSNKITKIFDIVKYIIIIGVFLAILVFMFTKLNFTGKYLPISEINETVKFNKYKVDFDNFKLAGDNIELDIFNDNEDPLVFILNSQVSSKSKTGKNNIQCNAGIVSIASGDKIKEVLYCEKPIDKEASYHIDIKLLEAETNKKGNKK